MKTVLLQDYLKNLFGKHSGVLARPEIEVLTVKTAEESFVLFREKSADLLMVDLDIPIMGGDVLCRLLKDSGETKKTHVAIIYSEKKSDLRRCDACGANFFLSRPLRAEDLYSAFCRALKLPERKGMRVLIKVTVHGRFKSEPFFCTSKDISVSGILLESDKILARGDVITCSFSLPNTDRIDARGEVVRVVADNGGYHYGVEFLDLSPDSKDTVGAFVSSSGANCST